MCAVDARAECSILRATRGAVLHTHPPLIEEMGNLPVLPGGTREGAVLVALLGHCATPEDRRGDRGASPLGHDRVYIAYMRVRLPPSR